MASKSNVRLLVAFIGRCSSCSCRAAFAQFTGNIQGVVQDPSGAGHRPSNGKPGKQCHSGFFNDH